MCTSDRAHRWPRFTSTVSMPHSHTIIRTATLEQPEHGLSEQILNSTDVLLWWGHKAHDDVSDAIVARVKWHVVSRGMGLIVLHSAHFSKLFKSLMGTSCDLKWREQEPNGEMERVWVVQPTHPIVAGMNTEYFELREEMYGEFFDVPTPDDLVLLSWFQGGELFRSGLTYNRGLGKIFYFRPGHESFGTYYNENVLRIIANAVQWAAPLSTGGRGATVKPFYGNQKIPVNDLTTTPQ